MLVVVETPPGQLLLASRLPLSMLKAMLFFHTDPVVTGTPSCVPQASWRAVVSPLPLGPSLASGPTMAMLS